MHLDRAIREPCLLYRNGGSNEHAGSDLIISWNVFDPICVDFSCFSMLLIETTMGPWWSGSRLLLSSHVSWWTFIFFVEGSHTHGYYNVEVRCITTFLHMHGGQRIKRCLMQLKKNKKEQFYSKKIIQWMNI